MEDLPIGSEITLKVVEDKKGECNGCFFNVAGYCGAAQLGLDCVPKYRSDKKSVIFKEVKE